MKVKAKGAGEAVGKKTTGKKKDEKKVLKVVAARNGTADPKVSLKAKKKRIRKKKNKANTNGIDATPQDKNEESSQAVADTNGAPQEANTENTVKKKGKKQKNTTAGAVDTSSSTAEPAEPATTETTEAATKTTESGENPESNTQGKKKRKRKSKRKASEALEATEGADAETTATESKDDASSSENKTKKKKGAKKMKLEEKKEVGDDAEGKSKNKVEEEKEVGDDAEGKSKNKSKKNKTQQEKKHVLFLGNLPFDVTEEEVREHFKAAGGSIVRVTLMTRQKSNKGKGYGFIEFSDAVAYEKALKLNMSQLKDRKINVQFTTPGRNTKNRRSFIKVKTQKLLGQKKEKKGKKKKKKGGKKD